MVRDGLLDSLGILTFFPVCRRVEPANCSRCRLSANPRLSLSRRSLVSDCARWKKIKVLLNFFQKIAVSKGKAFGRTPQSAKLLSVQAYFGELEDFLQEKKSSKTDCK